jgi:hypothetical protein
MVARVIVGLMLAMSAGAGPSASAANGRVRGILVAITDNSLRIAVAGTRAAGRTAGSSRPAVAAVRIDSHTSYIKWITHRPWQQDTRAGHESLAVGRCVEVKVRSNTSDVADLVRVSAEPDGSVFDPCKSLR